MIFDIGVSAIQGGRDYQEDSFVITDPYASNTDFSKLNNIMLLVADGVGGETAGSLASQIAGHSSAKYIQSCFDQTVSEQTLGLMLHGVGAAVNHELNKAIKLNPDTNGMATTLILCLVLKHQMRWVSIGDSHLYLIRESVLHKLNADHSMAAIFAMNVIDGSMSEADAASHPDRNGLLSYLDGGEIRIIDSPNEAVDLQEGDSIILASDGLDTLTSNEIVSVLTLEKNAQDSAQALTDCVTQAGVEGQDNTTVIVMTIKH
ncbi:hypothetical protein MNBD_GAMMA12-2754 [hydrothermal vent metagenome]|uniref:PPM-type phosphatase domain-containing protein n=1 Tax=hydrothermal vent metagenome TaxID=652676 RepID=A0A3B0Z2L6_9ZZZZ